MQKLWVCAKNTRNSTRGGELIMWKKTLTWFLQTSTIVGVPVTFYLLSAGVQKATFTFTCEMIGYECESAIGASSAVHDYINGLLQEPYEEEPPILNKKKK